MFDFGFSISVVDSLVIYARKIRFRLMKALNKSEYFLTWHLSGFMSISKRLFCCSVREPFCCRLFVDIKPSLLFVFVFSAVMLLFVDCGSLLFLWMFFEMKLLLLLLLLFTEIGLATFSMLSTINGGLTLSWDGSMVLDVLLFGEKCDWCEMMEWVLGIIDAEIGLRGGNAGIECDKTFGTITFDFEDLKPIFCFFNEK